MIESLWGIRAVCVVAATTVLGVFLSLESFAADSERRTGTSMCVECDMLNAQLRIVRDKIRTFEEGRTLLETTRRELRRDATKADLFAGAYMTLQGASIVLGVTAPPCRIPGGWLDGLIGSAAGIGSYVQERDVGQATLASIVAFVGLGIVNDATSLAEFAEEYREGTSDVAALDRHVGATIRRFDGMLNKLNRERENLRADLSSGGCETDDALSDLLRSSR